MRKSVSAGESKATPNQERSKRGEYAKPRREIGGFFIRKATIARDKIFYDESNSAVVKDFDLLQTQ